jgi:hypothetical protein
MKKQCMHEFVYKVNKKVKFSGILLTCNCEKTKCKKIVSIGLPYCVEHLISESNVTIKETLNKGKVVFAIKNEKNKSDNLILKKVHLYYLFLESLLINKHY